MFPFCSKVKIVGLTQSNGCALGCSAKSLRTSHKDPRRSGGPESAAYRCGDALQEFVEPYVNQLILARETDERTARAEVQQQLGLSRWVREAEMYQIVKRIFPDDLVLREASPLWLGRQRLDVFLPDRNLALEHQVEQHYQAVSVFGGPDALARTIERDELKKRLCEENSVELIYVRFTDSLTVTTASSMCDITRPRAGLT